MSHATYKKLFGPEAKNYTKYRTPYPEELFDFLISKIPNESKTILDIACGTGKSTEPLIATGLKVFGVDHDELMIEEAKDQAELKSLDIEYKVSETESLPFADNYFDVITIGTAFHFFANDIALAEIKRVLKPKGLLFVYWTLTTKDIPEEDDIPRAIFQKFNWVKIPSELRDLDNISNLFKNNNLQEVSTKSIPIAYNTSIEERVGLLTTSGFYETFSEEDKNAFLNDVREALTQKLGDRPYFSLEEEIQICYGFKE